MLNSDFAPVIDSVAILVAALLIDRLFGEPPISLHPTVWMGRAISHLRPKIMGGSPARERLLGIAMGFFVIGLFTVPARFLMLYIRQHLGRTVAILLSSILLKPTFAVKCMRQFTSPISEALQANDVEQAKLYLPNIVRRDPEGLGEQSILSAAVETIGEGTVDGITSPLFYYALLGVPGAVAYRVVNTLDSMVGYRDPKHINIGWFSARLDSVLNYIPARLTGVLMVASAALLGEDWRRSWKVMLRDRSITESPNAGWTMSSSAGMFNVQLEKQGQYALGDRNEELEPSHIYRALRVMEVTTVVFSVLVVVPVLLLRLVVLSGVWM